MVDRHLKIPHRFVVASDDPTGLDSDIEVVPLPAELLRLGHRFPKLLLFSPEAKALFGDWLLFLDLDLVILDDITPLISAHDFRIMRTFTERREKEMPYNSSLMLLRTGSRPQVWDRLGLEEGFAAERVAALMSDPVNRMGASDQFWIAKTLGGLEKTWRSDEDGVTIYRPDTLGALDVPPPGTRIVFFPGRFAPSMDLLQRRHPWVRENWR